MNTEEEITLNSGNQGGSMEEVAPRLGLDRWAVS